MLLYELESEKGSQTNIPNLSLPILPSSHSAKERTRREDGSSDKDRSILDMRSGVDVLLRGDSLMVRNRLQTLSQY